MGTSATKQIHMLRARHSLLASAVVTALLLSACGGSSNSSDTNTTSHTKTVTKTVTTAAPTPTSTTQTSTTTTRTTTAVPTASSVCAAAGLTPIVLGSNGAAGTVVYGFALRNTSSSTCRTYGWPGTQFLSSTGATVANPSIRTTHDAAGTVKPTAIKLSPGAEASFRVVVTDAVNGGAGCAPASFLQIYAPDDTVAMRVHVSATACPNSTVTPLEPGTKAFAGQ
jgi:hypothetical protein